MARRVAATPIEVRSGPTPCWSRIRRYGRLRGVVGTYRSGVGNRSIRAGNLQQPVKGILTRPLAEAPMIRGKPLEIVEYGDDQLLSPGILCCRRRGKEVQKIARLLGSFMPACRRRRDEVRFQFVLSLAQCSFVGLHLRQQARKIGGLLSCYPATMGVTLHRKMVKGANGIRRRQKGRKNAWYPSRGRGQPDSGKSIPSLRV